MTIKTNFLRLIFFLPVNQAKKIKRIWLKDKKHTEEKNIWQKVWREEEHAKMKLRENWISQYSKYLPASRELPIWSSTSLNRRLFVEIIKHMFCRLNLDTASWRKNTFKALNGHLKTTTWLFHLFWVRLGATYFSKQYLIHGCAVYKISRRIFWKVLRFKSRVAGWEARILPLC